MKRNILLMLAAGLLVFGCGGAKKQPTDKMIEDAMKKIEEGRLPDYASMPMTKTGSGLEYFDLVEGDGAVAGDGQIAVVHYHLWLTNGRRIDSSIMKQVPFEFELGVGKVIKGWDEGVKGMRIGTKRLLVVPSRLAYGSQGVPGAIPPNAPLIFYINLIELK